MHGKTKLLVLALLCILAVGGCPYAYRWQRFKSIPAGAWQCLRRPQKMTLYSIHPEEMELALVGAKVFHGFRILGEVVITSETDQQRVAREVEKAVVSFRDASACFNPRHGIRVENGMEAYDFVICYQCGVIQVHSGERMVADTTIANAPEVMNSLLRAAHVPLAD